ncbi:MAG: hypothetical protein SF029_01085 [bacterium]|nr:hypothetical protein [bacterium]
MPAESARSLDSTGNVQPLPAACDQRGLYAVRQTDADLLMARLLLMAVVGLTGIFALAAMFPLGAAMSAAEVYAARAFLTEARNCEAPCLMGIRPGMTTMDEALALLEAHEWVGEIEPPSHDGLVRAQWSWSGRQPRVIDSREPGLLSAGYILDVEAEESMLLVTNVRIRLHTRPAHLHLLLGETVNGEALRLPTLEKVNFRLYYPDTRTQTVLGLSSIVMCPARLDSYWRTPTELSLGVLSPLIRVRTSVPVSALPALCNAP